MTPLVSTSRVVRPISDAELNRRWALARAAMQRAGIEALVMRASEDWLGGYVKWFTDVPAANAYGTVVIFHAADAMTMIVSGAMNGHRPAGPEERGAGDVFTTSAFASVHYTGGYEGSLVGEVLAKRGYRTVGIVGREWLPTAFVEAVEAGTNEHLFVDATTMVDALKAEKSAEELARLRETAAMQDQLFERAIEFIRPGVRDIDLTALLQYEGLLGGSEQAILQCGAAPQGQRATFRRRHFQGRPMERGDHLTLLIENNGPGGYYTELARTIVLGNASNALLEATEAAREAQTFAVSALQIGRTGSEVFERYSAYLADHALPPERRLFAHGQGYDLVERPLIRSDETMALAGNMCFAVHPGWQTESLFVNLCDNYILSPDGGTECIHRTEKRVFEILL